MIWEKQFFAMNLWVRLDKDTYRIFINAESGMEENVEKMKNVESIYQDVI